MDRITYKDLVARYGTTPAYDVLLTLERLTQIKNEILYLDENVRLQKALDALNKVNFATQNSQGG